MKRKPPPGKKKAVGPKKLSERQRLWVAAMVEHGGDHKKAALAAKISEGQSRNYNSQEQFAHVRAALKAALDAVEEAAIGKAVWTRERLIAKFEEIGEAALSGVMSDETGLIKVNLRAACTAFAEIGKLNGFYVVKTEVKGKMSWSDLVAEVASEEGTAEGE